MSGSTAASILAPSAEVLVDRVATAFLIFNGSNEEITFLGTNHAHIYPACPELPLPPFYRSLILFSDFNGENDSLARRHISQPIYPGAVAIFSTLIYSTPCSHTEPFQPSLFFQFSSTTGPLRVILSRNPVLISYIGRCRSASFAKALRMRTSHIYFTQFKLLCGKILRRTASLHL